MGDVVGFGGGAGRRGEVGVVFAAFVDLAAVVHLGVVADFSSVCFAGRETVDLLDLEIGGYLGTEIKGVGVVVCIRV